MHLKTAPAIGPRYWAAISVASVVGCNMGDFVPDVLKMSAISGLLMLAALFAAILVADRWNRRGNEAPYWLEILVVRTAATNLADLSIARLQLGYASVAFILAVLLTALLWSRRASAGSLASGVAPRPDAMYWLTMLTAGTLGTVLADGIGHAIHPVTIGVPVSAIIATAALMAILGLRTRPGMGSAATYWIAIVAVRTWGTSVGDIAAFLLSLPVSLALSGMLLAVMLAAWRQPRPALGFSAGQS